jgi:tight adherence protein B
MNTLSLSAALSSAVLAGCLVAFAGDRIGASARALGRSLRRFFRLEELTASEARSVLILYILAPPLGAGVGYWAFDGLFGAALGALLATGAAKARTTTLVEKRRELLERQLPVALDQLVVLMRGQLTLSNAIAELAMATPMPLQATFAELHRRDQLFTPLEQCFEEVAAASRSTNLKLVLSALAVFSRQGGNAIEPLQQMSSSFKQIIRLSGKIRTAAAESKGNFRVINGGAAFMVGSIFFSQPQLLRQLTDSALGLIVLGVAAALWVGGYVWMRSLVRVDI